MRTCDVCGGSLAGRRTDALTCGAACRRERFRLGRLLRGEADGPYANLDEYLNRRQTRAKRSTED